MIATILFTILGVHLFWGASMSPVLSFFLGLAVIPVALGVYLTVLYNRLPKSKVWK